MNKKMQLNKHKKYFKAKKQNQKAKKKNNSNNNKLKKTRRRSRLVINPLTPMNDQNRISPHIIFTTSSTQVMRKKINID